MATRSSENRRQRWTANLLVGLFCAVVVLAIASAQSPCCVRELYKPEGWAIPGLSGAVVTASQSVEQQGAKILVEALKPQTSGGYIMIVSCASDTPGRVTVHEQAVEVREVRRYSVQGRVFAYRVDAGHVSIDGKTRVALGSAEVLMYYDTDGDGLFRLREYGSGIPYRMRVPDWVKVPVGKR
jgi:hypothetical protein